MDAALEDEDGDDSYAGPPSLSLFLGIQPCVECHSGHPTRGCISSSSYTELFPQTLSLPLAFSLCAVPPLRLFPAPPTRDRSDLFVPSIVVIITVAACHTASYTCASDYRGTSVPHLWDNVHTLRTPSRTLGIGLR